MKPFDLEAAMRGEPCVTRNGMQAKFLYKLNCEGALYPIIMIIKSDIHESVKEYTVDGKFDVAQPDHGYDLFMLTKKKKLWIAINKREVSESFYEVSNAYFTEDDLKHRGWNENNSHIIQVEIDE